MHRNYFLEMIRQLRQNEEVMLHENILIPDESESDAVKQFLFLEYQMEAMNFPFRAPEFDAEAAFRSAKIIYTAAQLILYRNHKESDLPALFPETEETLSPSAIISADLCLRFLPDMIFQLKMIDSQDGLIEILEKLAEKRHYSGMRCIDQTDNLDFTVVISDQCLLQLYVNRIISTRKIKLAMHETFRETVKSSLGNYAEELWSEFKLQSNYE